MAGIAHTGRWGACAAPNSAAPLVTAAAAAASAAAAALALRLCLAHCSSNSPPWPLLQPIRLAGLQPLGGRGPQPALKLNWGAPGEQQQVPDVANGHACMAAVNTVAASLQLHPCLCSAMHNMCAALRVGNR